MGAALLNAPLPLPQQQQQQQQQQQGAAAGEEYLDYIVDAYGDSNQFAETSTDISVKRAAGQMRLSGGRASAKKAGARDLRQMRSMSQLDPGSTL